MAPAALAAGAKAGGDHDTVPEPGADTARAEFPREPLPEDVGWSESEDSLADLLDWGPAEYDLFGGALGGDDDAELTDLLVELSEFDEAEPGNAEAAAGPRGR
jgi:hypothetical protein